MPDKQRILFYCIGNACRSPMAEAICRHLGGGEVEAQSAGVVPLGHVSANVYPALAALGIPSEGLYSKPLSAVNISADTLVISLAENFPVKRILGPDLHFEYEDWPVADPYGESPACYEGVARQLLSRIEDLLKRRGIIA
jgi:protein-tyrosine-phosphatase